MIAAAGASERMGGEDKLFIVINGSPVLAHTLDKFQRCRSIDEIIVVARADMLERICVVCKEYNINKATAVIVGGATRLESVLNGTMAVSNNAQLIAIHDGARPCVDIDVIERTIVAAAQHHAATPAVPVNFTIKKVEKGVVKETIDRKSLYEIQTPQVFDAALIKAALTNAVNKSLDVTDDCAAAEILGVPIYITQGSPRNIKLTTKEDIKIAEALL